MAITTLSRDYNPWVQALPSFLQNMALQKMGQRFRGQMIEQQREIDKKERKQDRETTLFDRTEGREYDAGLLEKERDFKLKFSEGWEETNQQDVQAGSDFQVRNDKFYVRRTKKQAMYGPVKKWDVGGKTHKMQQNLLSGKWEEVASGTPPTKDGKGSGGIPKTAKELRGEFIKQSGVFVSVRDAYNRVEASAKDPTPAGDLSLIFNYMKILDPGSVVRESEFATAANSGSVPSRIIAKYNKVLRGELLDVKMRQDFLNRSRQLYKKQVTTHNKLRSEYSRLSQRYKLDPALTIVDYLNPEKAPELSTAEGTEAQRLKKMYNLEDTN